MTLSALRAEPHIVAGALYDTHGRLFATYPVDLPGGPLPAGPERRGYEFEKSLCSGFQPVAENGRNMGTLYLRSDMGAHLRPVAAACRIAALVIAVSILVAYLMSRSAAAADLAADPGARRYGARHLGAQGLFRARRAHGRPRARPAHRCVQPHAHADPGAARAGSTASSRSLHLLQHITRAIGERQDLPSIFQVVLQSLEDDLPVDFGCVCLYDGDDRTITVATIGRAASALASDSSSWRSRTQVPIDANGLSRCVAGQLVYEPDMRELAVPVPAAPRARRAALAGHRAAARREPRLRRADRRAPCRERLRQRATANSCGS